MMQVTGKTSSIDNNSLSIQISLNGQTILYRVIEDNTIGELFSISVLCDYIKNKNVESVVLYLPQNQYIIIPTEIFSEQDCDKYLEAKNIRMVQDIAYNTFGDFTVVYPCREELNNDVSLLSEVCSVNLKHVFLKLLMMDSESDDDLIVFCYIEDFLYVVVKTDGEIEFVESFKVDNQTEIIPALERIIGDEKIEYYTIKWFGDLSTQIKSALKTKSLTSDY